jgi:ribosome-associated protein
MSNAPKKSIPRPGRKSVSDPPKVESTPPHASRQIALLAAQAGLEKKATGIEIIDVMGKVDYADFLVLMTGASDRNVAAIAQEVDGALAKAGFRSMSVEGLPSAQWVLIDFVDVVVHVFQKDVRSLYDLDGLWMDADRVPMQPGSVPSAELGASDDDSIVVGKRSKAPSKKRATKKAKTTARKVPRPPAAKAPSARKPAAGKAPRRAKTGKKFAKR